MRIDLNGMCRFSEANRRKLGNAVSYIAQKAKYPYKTEVLKLLFLMEEQMVQRYHVPFLGIPFSVWRMGPVSVDVFEELSDGPALLEEYITLQFNGQGIRVTPKGEFDDDEFSNAELEMMEKVMAKFGQMNSEELIEETHRDGGLWKLTAEENGLLEDFEQRRANSSSVVIDMSRGLCPDDRAFYQETMAVRQAANMLRSWGGMFAEGQLLRFDPFLFKNGAPSKPKFYVVLKHMGEDLMMASLPTSQDHIPGDLGEMTGCVSFAERGVNAYVFGAGEQVTPSFAFPLRTYVYGEQVDEYSQTYLDAMGSNVDDLGLLSAERLQALRDCVKQSPLIKRRYYKLL